MTLRVSSAFCTRFVSCVIVGQVALLPVAAIASVTLVTDATQGYYNESLGTILDGTQPDFPRANLADGDPNIFPAPEPDLSPAASILGGWLDPNPLPLNSSWKGPQTIPRYWAVNTETAIVYVIDGGQNGITGVRGNFGADNGLFVWVNGQFKFGAVQPGYATAYEYANIDLGDLNPGTNFIQVLREDHGNGTDYRVLITAASPPGPTPTGLTPTPTPQPTECPEDLCKCLPNAGKFSVVGGKVTGTLGKSPDFGPVGADIRESICGITGKFSGRLDTEFYLAGDAIFTSGVGTNAVGFRGYKLDGMPNPGVYIDGDVATGGGLVKKPEYAVVGGTTDTTGTDPRVATCQQALSELATASATLASLAPTQTLGTILVTPDDTRTITVGPGRQVLNIDSIKLKSRSGDGYILWSELDFVLDPATTVLVVNIAKGLSMGALGFISVYPQPPPPGGVIFNFLPGASLSLGAGADVYASLLAPTARIRALAYDEDTALGDLYTTKSVKLKGAYVPGYLGCQ